MFEFLKILPTQLYNWVKPNVIAFSENRQPKLWLLSLLLGILVAMAAIIFREMIGIIQLVWLGDRSEHVISAAARIPWYVILIAPAAGGLIVGLILQFCLAQKRALAVADVIEAATDPTLKVGFREGLWSALATVISLGSGASAGREGPVVHLGATISNAIARSLNLPDWSNRILLATGVAAAISASFNAPIAGVLFAHEVILRHYAMRAFVPIVIASSVAGVISHQWFGASAAFQVPEYHIASYFEFPAFVLLGIVSAIVAIGFQFSLFSADFIARKITMPLWLRPVLGGFMIGAIGIYYPHILGVGYEATDKALLGSLSLGLMLSLIVLKTFATSLSLASRFGGGIFSPSLYLGAMTGGAFGLIAASVSPELASSQALYSILGMGAVTGAVLGAPISTTLIVFELTGGYALSLALLLCVAISNGINQAIHGHSYFQWQLKNRGVDVTGGSHKKLKHRLKVKNFMKIIGADQPKEFFDETRSKAFLTPSHSVEDALKMFNHGGHSRLPVIAKIPQGENIHGVEIIGWASQIAALSYHNSNLIEASEEEHR